jgi:hypothetical protein
VELTGIAPRVVIALVFRSPIRFPCPACGKNLQAAPESVGAGSACPGCETPILVPSASSSRAQSFAANGLALVGIMTFVVATADGIERAQKQRELEALDAPRPRSISAAVLAGDPNLLIAGDPEPQSPQLSSSSAEGGGSESPPQASETPVTPSPASEPAGLPVQEVALPNRPDDKSGVRGGDPFSAGTGGARPADEPTELATAKTELESLTRRIEDERQRWKDALGLTANKTRPVREGSPAYHRCMEASKVIHEVESGAPALKAKKTQLEARIKELQE